MLGNLIRKTTAFLSGTMTNMNTQSSVADANVSKTKIEYNIGIFGTVSAGKSTLINAIFAKHYSQMNIRRTTMIPQKYHLASSVTDDFTKIKEANDSCNVKFQDELWDGTTILEHNVEMPSDFLIYDDTSDFEFNIYDFPGLNDQITKDVYVKWVNDNITIFDIVVLVIDIHSGLNTSDEVDMLRLFLTAMATNNHSHLIILSNKCDDMIYNQDTDIFAIDDEKEDIFTKQIVPTIEKLRKEYNISESRVTIQKFCSRTAFIYRVINTNTHDVMKHLDNKHLNEMMQFEIGRTKWVRMSEEQREIHITKTIDDITKDINAYNSSMLHSGFIKFINTIRHLTTNPYALLPVYEANIMCVLNKFTNDTRDISVMNQIFDGFCNVISLLKNMNTSFDVKESLLQSILTRFKNWIATDQKDTYVLQQHIMKRLMDFQDCLDECNFQSDEQKTEIALIGSIKYTELLSFIEASTFQHENTGYFHPNDFMTFYDDVLMKAATRFANENASDLHKSIPLCHPLVWNNEEYIRWTYERIAEDNRSLIMQRYITYILCYIKESGLITKVHTMFLHYILYQPSFIKLNFQNTVIVRECLIQFVSNGHTATNECFNNIEMEMKEAYGNFYDLIIEMI